MTTGSPQNPNDPDTSGDTGRDARAQAELPTASLWLADGYNLLHCAPFRAAQGPQGRGTGTAGPGGRPFWSAEMRERLVTVARRFAHPHAALWIVFDGPRPSETSLVPESRTPPEAREPESGVTERPGEPDGSVRPPQPELHVCFAPSADDWIVRRVKTERRQNDQAVAVVTGDRKLGNRARHHQAAVVSPRLFLAHCGADRDAEDNLE